MFCLSQILLEPEEQNSLPSKGREVALRSAYRVKPNATILSVRSSPVDSAHGHRVRSCRNDVAPFAPSGDSPRVASVRTLCLKRAPSNSTFLLIYRVCARHRQPAYCNAVSS